MKLDEAIREVAQERDSQRQIELVRIVADFMRFRLGWNYSKSLECVEKSGVDRDLWEELLYKAS